MEVMDWGPRSPEGKAKPCTQDPQMTSSTVSSLASPGDSGVQLLDSESEVTSVMSVSLEPDDKKDKQVMTKSDIANQNVTEFCQLSKSAPSYFDKFDYLDKLGPREEVFEMEHPIKSESDLMNVSLNSYELLDYTQQNTADQMHVSMSEEVNENLKVTLQGIPPIVEGVPVVEEQIVFRRQRKKKSKSDTPKKRVSFHEDILNSTKIDDIHINLGFVTREIRGRYSWGSEGEALHYDRPEREVKSDLYANQRYSTSSSSTGSTGSTSSSIDEDSEEKHPPTFKQPKSSCLKKSKKKRIDTNIVQETKRKSDSNLLDSNIFGSLKNILNFSTSVPLAERGVPEGQEDIVYSTPFEPPKVFNFPEKVEKVKPTLKLTASEGFYPNYPEQQMPANVIICDSNVYEHKGISYSFEYDKFQKSFEQSKPKTSVYQMIQKFNFFRKKARQPPCEDFEVVPPEEVEEVALRSPPSSTKLDWSDNDTYSEMSEGQGGRHLNSPKKRRANHYSLSPFKRGLEMRPSSSKASMINKFLRGVTMRKMMEVKRGRGRCMELYVRGCHFEGGRDEVDEALEREVRRGRGKGREGVDRKVEGQLKKDVFRSKMERLVKVFPVRSAYATSGDSRPLLVALSDSTLYIAGFKPANAYCNHFVLPYPELDTIIIGPNAQTIHLSNHDKDMQCLVTTGCANITSNLVAQLEIAMRRDPRKPRLPAVKQLSMRDMANLRRAICKQTSVDKDEDYFYYSVVNIQDFDQETEVTPLGPNKEGPLMFKAVGEESRWETAYFILKAGVLYMLSSASQRVPLRVFPLINGSCQGARRLYNCPRPHTFQLVVEGRSLHLAAPDEYVASDWLQCLVHAASKGFNLKEKTPTQSCSLMLTSDHIATVREAFPCTVPSLLPPKNQHQPIRGPQVLSCAAIGDLISFRLPSAEQSWCILEFSCREVHECSGDWILYFSTNAELESFISTLEQLWSYGNENGDSFPLSTIPETDPLSRKCIDVYTCLKNSWPCSSVHLQFL